MTGKNGPRLTHPPPVPAAPRRRIHRAASRRVGAAKPRSEHRELIGTRIAGTAGTVGTARTAGDPSINEHERGD
ncbi:hypothetical protein GCM10022226_51860 [Sphaerisporangium flaviroseum]|uniref:Uncharacterized protein n=1 Tax=Sphaerisporangium flaviroseum TaxID=509199 RepID=A0ABP7IRT0_9ACTN